MSKLRPREGKSLSPSHTVVSRAPGIGTRTGDSKSSAPRSQEPSESDGHTHTVTASVSQEWGCPPAGPSRRSSLMGSKNVSLKGRRITSTFLQGTYFSRGDSLPGIEPQSPARPSCTSPWNQLASGFEMLLSATQSNAFYSATPNLSTCLSTHLSFVKA